MRITGIALLILLLLAGCRESAQPNTTPQAENVTFELVSVDPETLAVGDATLAFQVLQLGQPLANAQVAVRGDMNHAGMVPVEESAVTDAEGIARVPFEWTMGGEWIISVTVTTPDSQTISGSFNMQIPA